MCHRQAPWMYRLVGPSGDKYAGELVNLVSSRMTPAIGDICLKHMLHGEINTPKALESLSNPCVLSDDVPGLLDGLDRDAAPDMIQGKQALSWLPDLADSQAGRPKLTNAWNVRPFSGCGWHARCLFALLSTFVRSDLTERVPLRPVLGGTRLLRSCRHEEPDCRAACPVTVMGAFASETACVQPMRVVSVCRSGTA